MADRLPNAKRVHVYEENSVPVKFAKPKVSVVDRNDALTWAMVEEYWEDGESCCVPTEKEAMAARLEELAREERFLIRPDSDFMQRWDLVIIGVLFFTATITRKPFTIHCNHSSLRVCCTTVSKLELYRTCSI
jgi:hypothetical protein